MFSIVGLPKSSHSGFFPSSHLETLPQGDLSLLAESPTPKVLYSSVICNVQLRVCLMRSESDVVEKEVRVRADR